MPAEPGVVNLLDLDLNEFLADALAEAEVVAFVDRSSRGRTTRCPRRGRRRRRSARHGGRRGGVHRPPGELRGDGDVMTEYLADPDLDPPVPLATALVFTIRRETLTFLRGTTGEDYGADGHRQMAGGHSPLGLFADFAGGDGDSWRWSNGSSPDGSANG
jgi:hypothetical protein